MRLVLVDLAPRHLEITRSWRNHPASRAWFGDAREITPEAQRAWFAGRIRDDSDRIYILEDDGRPVAQLVPVRKRRASPLGAMRGQFEMADGWERPLNDEEAETFWGGR